MDAGITKIVHKRVFTEKKEPLRFVCALWNYVCHLITVKTFSTNMFGNGIHLWGDRLTQGCNMATENYTRVVYVRYTFIGCLEAFENIRRVPPEEAV